MKVLVADDEAISRRLIESSLVRWGYDVVVAKDGLESLNCLLAPNAPQLAVIDWMMPGLDGVELCRTVRERKMEFYTYILLLTVRHAKTDIVAGLEAGADDYITKPFDPQEFRVRLRNGKRILCLMDQLTTARETLRELAARDPLTNLWHRKSTLELLASELNRANRQKSSVAVVMADLDHFKKINESYGNLVGDRVLCEVANALRGAIRPYDAVGRYGGEEFLIVLPGCDRMNALAHCERLRRCVGDIKVKCGDQLVSVSASFGVTVVDSDCRAELEAAVEAADVAMHSAKQNGRNRVEFLESTLGLV